MALSLLLLRISVKFILRRLYETKHQPSHCITQCAVCTSRCPYGSVHFMVSLYNELNKICQKIVQLRFHTDDWNSNLRNFSPDNLLQLGLVQLYHISAQSQICNTQYMLLTHADDLLCLQLHTVRSPHTVHASNQCRWLAVPTAAHSRSPHTVHASNQCRWLAVPTAAHSTVSIHSIRF